MSENRLPDYLDHMQLAANDACSFVEGLAKEDFLIDKRTQRRHQEPDHHWRGRDDADGWLRRFHPVAP